MNARRWLAVGSLIVACLLGGSLVRGDIYFSPGGGTETRLINEINLCRRTLDCAVFNISSSAVARAIVAAKNRGVTVRVVSDYSQWQSSSSQVNYLRSNGVQVHILGSTSPYQLMHDKYAVFDNARMETGSYNWTVSANTTNYENADFMSDAATVTAYEGNFNRLWALAHR